MPRPRSRTLRTARALALAALGLAVAACGGYTATDGDALVVDRVPFDHLDASTASLDPAFWLDNGFFEGDLGEVLEQCARPLSLRPGGARSEAVRIDGCDWTALPLPQLGIVLAVAQTLPSVSVAKIPRSFPVSIDARVDLGGPVCDLQVTAMLDVDLEWHLVPDDGEWRDFPGGPGIVVQGTFGGDLGDIRDIDADAQCGNLITNGQVVGLLEGIPDGALDVRLRGGVEARTLLEVAPGFGSLTDRKRVIRRVAAPGGSDWELSLSVPSGVLPQPHGDDWFEFLEPDLAAELLGDVIAALDPPLSDSFGEVHDSVLTGVNSIVTKGSHDAICGISLETKPITVDGLPGSFDSLYFRASRGSLVTWPTGQTGCLSLVPIFP